MMRSIVLLIFFLFSIKGKAQTESLGYNRDLDSIFCQPLHLHDGFLSQTRNISWTTPKQYQYEHLPVFCKIEEKLFRRTHLNVKIRLGNVDYVDRLEGKK